MTQLALGTIPFCLPGLPRPSPRMAPIAATPSGVTTMEGERQASNGAASTRHSPDAAAAAAPSAARSFVRRHLLTLAPYTPIEPFEVLSARLGRSTDDIIKLDANENPYGPPPDVLAALGSMAFPNIYPDPANRRLRDAIAAQTGVPAEHLLVRGCCSLAAAVRWHTCVPRRSAPQMPEHGSMQHRMAPSPSWLSWCLAQAYVQQVITVSTFRPSRIIAAALSPVHKRHALASVSRRSAAARTSS